MTAVMIGVFFLLMLLGVPLFIALLGTAAAGIAVIGDYSLLFKIPQQFFGGMDGFTLMAIPLFIFTGSLMNISGLTDRLVRFTQTLVGRLRGGLGYVNVLASILFAGVNASAAADTSALGSVLIPAMEKDGFDRPYAAGLTAGSSLIGPIIPPSIFMILYANMTNTSVGGLFAAGIVPGLLLGAAFFVLNFLYSRKHEFPVRGGDEAHSEKPNSAELVRSAQEKTEHSRKTYSNRKTVRGRKPDPREILWSFLHALPALAAPLIIIGGILFGVFTPTESGAAAVVFILLVGFFHTRRLSLRNVWTAILESGRLTASIFLIIGAAAAVAWVLTYQRVPAMAASLITGTAETPLAVLLLLSGIIFIFGMFMEEIASLVLLTPIFAPLALQAGIDPYHFGIIMVLNITIALITPPMGGCLFIVSAVGKVELDALFRKIWPFVLTALIALGLIILIPPLTTLLPSILGF